MGHDNAAEMYNMQTISNRRRPMFALFEISNLVKRLYSYIVSAPNRFTDPNILSGIFYTVTPVLLNELYYALPIALSFFFSLYSLLNGTDSLGYEFSMKNLLHTISTGQLQRCVDRNIATVILNEDPDHPNSDIEYISSWIENIIEYSLSIIGVTVGIANTVPKIIPVPTQSVSINLLDDMYAQYVNDQANPIKFQSIKSTMQICTIQNFTKILLSTGYSNVPLFIHSLIDSRLLKYSMCPTVSRNANYITENIQGLNDAAQCENMSYNIFVANSQIQSLNYLFLANITRATKLLAVHEINDKMQFSSDDEYCQFMEKYFGEEIFGKLTPEEIDFIQKSGKTTIYSMSRYGGPIGQVKSRALITAAQRGEISLDPHVDSIITNGIIMFLRKIVDTIQELYGSSDKTISPVLFVTLLFEINSMCNSKQTNPSDSNVILMLTLFRKLLQISNDSQILSKICAFLDKGVIPYITVIPVLLNKDSHIQNSETSNYNNVYNLLVVGELAKILEKSLLVANTALQEENETLTSLNLGLVGRTYIALVIYSLLDQNAGSYADIHKKTVIFAITGQNQINDDEDKVMKGIKNSLESMDSTFMANELTCDAVTVAQQLFLQLTDKNQIRNNEGIFKPEHYNETSMKNALRCLCKITIFSVVN